MDACLGLQRPRLALELLGLRFENLLLLSSSASARSASQTPRLGVLLRSAGLRRALRLVLDLQLTEVKVEPSPLEVRLAHPERAALLGPRHSGRVALSAQARDLADFFVPGGPGLELEGASLEVELGELKLTPLRVERTRLAPSRAPGRSRPNPARTGLASGAGAGYPAMRGAASGASCGAARPAMRGAASGAPVMRCGRRRSQSWRRRRRPRGSGGRARGRGGRFRGRRRGCRRDLVREQHDYRRGLCRSGRGDGREERERADGGARTEGEPDRAGEPGSR